jgi:hypothetical protein
MTALLSASQRTFIHPVEVSKNPIFIFQHFGAPLSE